MGLLVVMMAQQALPAARTTKPLPDVPIAKVNPCADVKPGDLCNGRRYYPDLLGLDTHDATWLDAARNPTMIVTGVALVSLATFDVLSTQAAERRFPHGVEANPLMGRSHAQQWTVGVGGSALLWALSVRRKQDGHGVSAFFIDYLTAAAHLYAGLHNEAL
jgi:hypothetical protein